ncbi:MAG TPA: type II secretion system protein GspG [Pseudobdellovibrionaceae bacterium]|nr:type II secretion system protein GspG [Pseudobdellovibrionaceae bacterium]
MIEAIAKSIPVVTMAGGAAASSDEIKAQIQKVIETTKVIATQQEVNDIAKMIYLDTIDGSHPKVSEFAAYLQRNMMTKNNIQRDTSKDQWGTAYVLRYDKNKNELRVSSAGPDTKMNTPDDIIAAYPYKP